jgi:hypothetical protein
VPPPLGLQPLRQWAPATLFVVIAGIWLTFGYVAYQIFRIARIGGQS